MTREPTRAEWRDWAAGIEKPEPPSLYSALQVMGLSMTPEMIYTAQMQAAILSQTGLCRCPYCGQPSQLRGVTFRLWPSGGIFG